MVRILSGAPRTEGFPRGTFRLARLVRNERLLHLRIQARETLGPVDMPVAVASILEMHLVYDFCRLGMGYLDNPRPVIRVLAVRIDTVVIGLARSVCDEDIAGDRQPVRVREVP